MLVNDNGVKRDVSILDVTPENYIVPKGEEHLYHYRIEMVEFDSKSGVRKSRPKIDKTGKKAFEQTMLHTWRNQGYKVDILHNPTEWMKKTEAEKAEAERKAKEAKKKAEEEAIQKRIDEAVNKAVADALKARSRKPKTEEQ